MDVAEKAKAQLIPKTVVTPRAINTVFMIVVFSIL